uniref:Putative secreted protein n=1 Tax=Anopheles darlingi TaxID=43151 RepID=A0A2M4DE85_ANODA
MCVGFALLHAFVFAVSAKKKPMKMMTILGMRMRIVMSCIAGARLASLLPLTAAATASASGSHDQFCEGSFG